jgi:DNA polymerase III epsilon subunit-like protein
MLRAWVADTETTGADSNDRPCEVAWYEIDEHLSVLDERHSLIDPQMPISATASGIHGITNADVADAPTMVEFVQSLGADFFGEGDEILLIAHNVAFDRRMLQPYFPITDELCTLRLARRIWPKAENHKLPTLMYLLNLERGKSHSAHGDVHTCFDLLRRIVDTSGEVVAGALQRRLGADPGVHDAVRQAPQHADRGLANVIHLVAPRQGQHRQGPSLDARAGEQRAASGDVREAGMIELVLKLGFVLFVSGAMVLLGAAAALVLTKM